MFSDKEAAVRFLTASGVLQWKQESYVKFKKKSKI